MEDFFSLQTVKNPIADLIENVTQKKACFDELDIFDQRKILKIIKNQKLDIKAFGKRWYDILTKSFYVKEYVLDDSEIGDIKEELHSLKTFQEFFDCCNGDIYKETCLYGYEPTKQEVEKNKILINMLNFKSLIDKTVDDFTYESIEETNEEVLSKKIEKAKKIALSVKRSKFEDSKQIKKFLNNSFTYEWHYSDSIFPLILQKCGRTIEKPLIDYVCKNGFHSLRFAQFLLLFGEEAAQTVIDHFNGGYARNTRKQKIREFKADLELYRNNKLIIVRDGKFDNNTGFYVVTDNYYISRDNYYSHIDYYFATFDEYKDFLGNDLSNQDLRDAPISEEELVNCKTNNHTILPANNEKTYYTLKKEYKDGIFRVTQEWFDNSGKKLLTKCHNFEHFFDFIYFLKGDLSNADLLMCEGLENAKDIKGINWDKVKVRSYVAEALGIKQKHIQLIEHQNDSIESQKNELETIDTQLLTRPDDDDYMNRIRYITDIHLLHRIEANHCKTEEDIHYLIRKIALDIATNVGITLIGGDTSSSFSIFENFIKELHEADFKTHFFFTLGNHELWSFHDKKLSEIINIYRTALENERMHLLHNNLYYFKLGFPYEITEQELLNISPEDLKEKVRGAHYIIFGGIGFSGKNEHFNANNGIYMEVLNREEEIKESEKFYKLYKKVSQALSNRNITVLTHMPMIDWAGNNDIVNGFVYVSGHNHRNYYYDDGNKRIFADNQIGYKGKNVSLKYIPLDFLYDWFIDWKDGIYEITKEDYINFYRGINEGITFNRKFNKLYLIKREKTYMFLMQNDDQKLFILNGGAIKSSGGHTLDYFYENISNYSKSVRLFLSKFDSFQKEVSKTIKSIGGDGYIHGSIVDIDFFNHLYLNPIDGSVTPYYATSMVDKHVYKNLRSLLKYRCPELSEQYEAKLLENSSTTNALILADKDAKIEKKAMFVYETDMYKFSRILKGLQFTTKYNVVRVWSDTFASQVSEENGKLIVKSILLPENISIDIEKKKN